MHSLQLTILMASRHLYLYTHKKKHTHTHTCTQHTHSTQKTHTHMHTTHTQHIHHTPCMHNTQHSTHAHTHNCEHRCPWRMNIHTLDVVPTIMTRLNCFIQHNIKVNNKYNYYDTCNKCLNHAVIEEALSAPGRKKAVKKRKQKGR